MFDYLQALLIGNIIFFMLYFPAAILNFKYYFDLKLKDNLLVGVYFLFAGLQVLLVAIARNYDQDLFFYVDIFSGLWLTSLFLIGVRIRWSHIPWPIYPLLLLFLWQLIAAFFTTSFTDRTNVDESVVFIEIYTFTFVFVLFALLTSSLPLTMTKIRTTKNFWLVGAGLNIFANVFWDIMYWTGWWSSKSDPLLVFYIGLLPQYIGAVAFFILHVFFPEAVLFSEEQLYRARELYVKVQMQKTPSDQSMLKIGSSTILDYLNSIPEDLKQQLARSRE